MNGITDFSGNTYDAGPVPAKSTGAAIEGSGAGGMGNPSEEITNAVTDFSGRTYDSGP